MVDIHCHILPQVDDGSRTLYESLAMARAAANAGVTHIVATPHCRDPYFDYDAMVRAYHELKHALELEPTGNAGPTAPARGRADLRGETGCSPLSLSLGFEVHHSKLIELGLDWAARLCTQGEKDLGPGFCPDFLLELSTRADEIEFRAYERTIAQLQGLGMHVVIAHPERYGIIQQSLSYAERLRNMGCGLQLSARSLGGSRFGRLSATARKLSRAGLYTHIASDAHCVEDYELFERAVGKYGVRMKP